MSKKKCNLNMVLYELRNINGNLMTHFFGIVFPNLMSLMFAKAIGGQVPAEQRQEVIVSIMISMSMVMPLSVMFLGYGAVYSQEVEREIPLRMHLFGFREKSLIAAKIIAHVIFLTIAFGIYAVVQMLALDIPRPAFTSLLCLLLSLYLIGAIFMVIIHSLANICRKFSITYGVSMAIYFLVMIVTGMMGLRTEQLPEALQKVSRALPMTYISNDFGSFWQGGSYNFMPFIQSFIFLGAVAGILCMAASAKKRL